MSPPSITVVGSVNLDLVARVERLPRPGETVTDATFDRVPWRQGGEPGGRVRAARRRRDARLRRRRRRVRGRGAAGRGRARSSRRSACSTADRHGADPGRRGRREPDRVAPGANAELGAVELAASDAVLCQLEMPGRDGAERLGAGDRAVLPERRARAADRRRRRPRGRQPLRARGAEAPRRPRRGDARGRGRAAARGRGGGRARRAAAGRRRRRHGCGGRLHRVPARLAARGARPARRRCAARAPPARSPPRASARSRRCRPRPRSTR